MRRYAELLNGARRVAFGTFVAFVPFVAFDASASPRAHQSGELIERTLAIVGGQAITLSDLRTATALGLIEDVQGDLIASGTPRLVDRLLVLREVQRYMPPEPSEAAIEARLAALQSRAGSAEALQRILEAGGFTAARLRAWIRDDLRIAAYLGQRFAAAGSPSEEDVAAYFNRHRGEFEQKQLGYEQAAPLIRERLSAERREALIEDWIADLRRRTGVVELWKNPA